MNRNKLILYVFSFCALTSITSCKIEKGKYTEGVTEIFCDDGFQRILNEEISVFEYQYPKSSIIPKYVSEQEAIDAFMDDRVDAIIVTQELTKSQIEKINKTNKKTVRQSPIAVDAVALVVNKDNPLDNISMDEIANILKGKINKWSELAVPMDGDIQLIFDNQGSSTVSYLRGRFLDGKKITDNPNVNVSAVKNNLEVLQAIQHNPNAIGIVSVSCLGDTLQIAKNVPVEERLKRYNDETEIVGANMAYTEEVKILGVKNPLPANDYTLVAYKPYQVYIETGEYPLVRKIYMIITGANKLNKAFYDFVTGFAGQKIIALTGILPYHIHSRVVEVN